MIGRPEFGTYAWFYDIWFTESYWRRSKKGNLYFAGSHGQWWNSCTIFPKNVGFSYVLSRCGDSKDKIFSPNIYGSEEEAKVAAFHDAMKRLELES